MGKERGAGSTASLLPWIDAWRGKRIVVWGDLVADHTIYGDTSRISREAPVLILRKEWDTVTPGGAGNAVMNVAALGGRPVPVGVVGGDPMGQRLLDHLAGAGADTSHVVRAADSETAIKMRVLAGGLHTVKQQVIRIDSDGGYDDVGDEEIERGLRDALQRAEGLIVSDYGLGTARPRLFGSLARKGSLLSVIDSRHALSRYGGATSATPNEPELEEQAGVPLGEDPTALDRAARQVLQTIRLEALLVTRGREGMALFQPRRKRVDLPVPRVQEIVDVTGAGDTVIATYTLALAAGADFEAAARLANVAAGLSVMKRGPAAPTDAELRRSLEELST